MPTAKTAPANLLLAALPAIERQRLLAGREPVQLALADTLTEPGERIRHVFFPIESFISLIATVDRHSQLEVGLVGNEGMLGAPLILGVDTSPLRGLVQGAGPAWRLDSGTFRRELERSPALRQGLNRYLYVLLSQLAQSSGCTRFHVLEARLARWLLMTRDRAHSNRFHVTQEFLALMLGVRRTGVTQAASSLQHRKLIRYRRGELQILDGRGLEGAACACYEIGRRTYARVLG